MNKEVPMLVENGQAREMYRLSSKEQLRQGMEVLLLPNEAAVRFIEENNAVGQLDVGIQPNGLNRGYPLLHIRSKGQT